MNDEKNLVDITECVCADSLDTPEDRHLYFGTSSRERYLIWAHFKSGHFTFKCITFPSGVLHSWQTEVLPVLFELFRQDSFMRELFSSSAFRPYLHRRCEKRTL